MRVTFRSSFGAPPVVSTCDWTQLVFWLKNQALVTMPSKDACTMIAYTDFVGGWKRQNMGLEGLWALNLDFDKVPLGQVQSLIQRAHEVCPGERFLMHTTYQHGCLLDAQHDQPLARLRVIYPTEVPLSAPHYCEAWAEATNDFAGAGHVVDPATSNPERCWFVPAINPNAPEWARAPWVQEFEK